jgi:hypothetical protein
MFRKIKFQKVNKIDIKEDKFEKVKKYSDSLLINDDEFLA